MQDGWNPAKAGSTGNSNYDVWADLNADGSLKTRYLNGDRVDQLLARTDYVGTTGTVEYLLTDYQGSIRTVVNGSGTIEDQTSYDCTVRQQQTDSRRNRRWWAAMAGRGSRRNAYTGLQYADRAAVLRSDDGKVDEPGSAGVRCGRLESVPVRE